MLLPLLLPVLSALVSAVEVKRPRGVSLTNHHFYEESKPFTCLDGSSTIAFDWVNDDYCDCQDGSDEPGTSACPTGRFHCTNAGYRPQYIPSSRVNDGVCDCCDATDEYNSGFVCENTCKEMGRKERETLAQMAEVAREGFQLKQVLIEEASKGREDKQRTLAELQEGKKSLEEQVETLRSGKETAEKPEKEAKEIHQKKWEEQKAAEMAAREQARASEAFQELDDDGDGLVSVAELQTHAELDVDGDGTLSETEAQVWRGAAFPGAQRGAAFPGGQRGMAFPGGRRSPGGGVPREEAPEPQPDLSPEQPAPEDDYEEEEEEEGDDEESNEEEPKVARGGAVTWPSWGRSLWRPQSLQQSPHENLEKEISFDFGPQGEFAYLYSQCYELTTNEYVYRLCPFNRVSQKPKHGGAETNLG
uniref:Protein kinase C substrate 80K-H n=1 Tax=Chelydra serpentina TaxID=8475 RepID=A0A8C3S5Q9_CHESE